MAERFGKAINIEAIAELSKDMKGYRKEIRPALRRALRYVSKELIMERVKAEMPVDTGRARAGWGIWRASDMIGGKAKLPREVSKKELSLGARSKGFYRSEVVIGGKGRGPADVAGTTEQFIKPGAKRLPIGSIFISAPGNVGIGYRDLSEQIAERSGGRARTIYFPTVYGKKLSNKEYSISPYERIFRVNRRRLEQQLAAGPQDAIWIDKSEGDTPKLEIIQGTTIWYVRLLNDGSSFQAPKGFITKAIAEGIGQLEKEVGKELAALFAKRRGKAGLR